VPLLEVEELRAGRGSVAVLHDVSLEVQEGETDVLLGRGGAGKTTALLSLAGLHRVWGGEVRFAGEPVTGMDAGALVARGLVLVPQGRHVVAELTVEQNLRLGAWAIRRDRRAVARGRQLVFDLFPELAESARRPAGSLSAGRQQMLALGRGLMASPRMMLVDEASYGLAPDVAAGLFRLTRRLNAEGVTLLMAEQNAGILRHADRAFVMDRGRMRFSGTGRELVERGELREAFFGAAAP